MFITQQHRGLFHASRSVITLVAILGVISACGGGGGSNAPAAPPVASTPPPAPTPDPTPDGNPAPAPDDGFTPGVYEPLQNYAQLCANPRTGASASGTSFPDSQGTTADENNWIRSWSNYLYLWYGEITDVNPSSQSTPEYFRLMKTFATTPSGALKDKFHFTIPTDEWEALSQSGISGGYGLTFSFISSRPPRQVVVAYTEPNTPATAPAANIQRGATILEVDGVDMVNASSQADVDVLNAALFPGDNETHVFKIQDVGGGAPRSVSLTSKQILSTPVQNIRTIETQSGLVGYMTFNDHIATAEKQLIDAFTSLAAQNISDLVIDLRYNGGGFLDIANEVGFMVAGPAAAQGRIFEQLQFNDKHTTFNPVTGGALTPTRFRTTARGFSAPAGQSLPSLGLSRLFVLTGPGTCSASESIMNGLRGIDVEVIQIGATTCGKPYGFYPFDNCGTTYFSIQFRGINDKGFGDYSDGFSPKNVPTVQGVPVSGCFVSDDFTKQLGDPNEGRLKAALAYRETGNCPTVISAESSARSAVSALKPLDAVDGYIAKPAWLTNRIMSE